MKQPADAARGTADPTGLKNTRSGVVFNQGLWDQVIERLPFTSRLLVQRSWRSSKLGLQAARAGRIATAQQCFEESEVSTTAGDEVTLLSQSFREAARAYADFRDGKFELAVARLEAARRCDESLERQGITILYMHRIQLLHNRVRIDIRREHLNAAADLAGRTVRHLSEGAAPPIELGNAPANALESIPKNLVEEMNEQIRTDWTAVLRRLAEVPPADHVPRPQPNDVPRRHSQPTKPSNHANL